MSSGVCVCYVMRRRSGPELPDPGPCITCLHITDCPRPDLRLYREFESNHRNVLSFSARCPLGILRQVKKAVSNKTTAFFVTRLFLVFILQLESRVKYLFPTIRRTRINVSRIMSSCITGWKY